jgi:hypothetical protein
MYATERTITRPGRSLEPRWAGSPASRENRRPLLLCKSVTMRLMARQRKRGAIFLATMRARRSDPMVSFWWVLMAFFGGGCAGILVMSLMQMAGGLPEQSALAPDLNGMPW